MAENSNEVSMPTFMQKGMDFFTGKTVLASTLAAETEKLNAANARINELEAAAVDPKPLNDRISALESEAKQKDATIKEQAEQISRLEENYKTAARQAQEQIAKAGASAPVTTEAPKNQEAAKDDADKFIEQYSARIAKGMTSVSAISEIARTSPSLHVAFIKSGKKLS